MSRFLIRLAALTALLPVFIVSKVQAQGPGHGYPQQPMPTYYVGQSGILPVSHPSDIPARFAPHQQPRPIHLADSAESRNSAAKDNPGPAAPAVAGPAYYPYYPYLNAPLYPVPQPYIPRQVGGAMIVNQALAPHEMLYPHTYRALYPPYYYSVKGSWLWTPFGMRSHDRVRLEGTEVKVKYRGNYGLLSGFVPPVIR
jgi:hypothetical protein